MRPHPAPTDLEAFWRRLERASQRALLLDYDGTLAPFRMEREQAFPHAGVREALASIRDDGTTRLVVVSGRSPGTVVRLLGLVPPPEVWGGHGLERRFPDGRATRASIDARAQRGLDAAETWARSHTLENRLEWKHGCLALHWRGLGPGEADEMRDRALAPWTRIAAEADLEVRPFDGGLELRCRGPNKGDAVRTVLEEMEGRPAVAYLGDDLTDEDAFRAVRAVGPWGLGVLVRQVPRPTEATLWLRPPEQLLAFLEKWDDITRRSRSED